MDNLYIVIPAYNEEETIETVVREWYQIVERTGGESRLVVIDDGSKDSTGLKLRELAKEMLRLEACSKTNGGHGPAVLYGYEYALKHGADYIFQTDSDGQTLPEEFDGFWKKRKEYDAVIGHRKGRQDGGSRVFVTKVLKLVLWMIFGVWVTDANTPYRLMTREILERHMTRMPEQFNLPNVLLTVSFLKENEKVLFLPVTFRPRQGGKNSINLPKITRIGFQAIKDFRQIKTGFDKNSFKEEKL